MLSGTKHSFDIGKAGVIDRAYKTDLLAVYEFFNDNVNS